MKRVALLEAHHEYRNPRHPVRRPNVQLENFKVASPDFPRPELGGKAVSEAIRRAGLDSNQIDEAILGNVVQAGLGQNPARQAALRAAAMRA